MTDKVFVRDNELVRRSSEKLYLDSRTADVYFIFSTDTDRVPAHKNILSTESAVFDAMFYGALIEKDDILIVDASASAFREFLQFFYLNKVKLTPENIGVVTNLCNKYELPEALKVCEAPFQMSLTNSEICWGFEIAHFFELDNLKRFCEKKIKEYPQEVLMSDSFMECSRKSVDKILQLYESKSSTLVYINACMEWAKAECERNNLEASAENLRLSLDDTFNRIPFGNITMDQFFEFISNNTGFVELDEIEKILKVIAKNKFQSSPYADVPLSILPNLNCDRRISTKTDLVELQFSLTWFEVNTTILLSEFYLPKIVPNKVLDDAWDIFYTIHGPFTYLRGDLALFDKVTMNIDHETHVVLEHPLVIEAKKWYGIGVTGTLEVADLLHTQGFSCERVEELTNEVDLGNGVEIKFSPCGGSISRMKFLLPKH